LGWDDIYDRYEETPGYNKTLRLALLQQFLKDREAGRIIFSEGRYRWKIRSDFSDDNKET
jgi:hypothetical protein